MELVRRIEERGPKAPSDLYGLMASANFGAPIATNKSPSTSTTLDRNKIIRHAAAHGLHSVWPWLGDRDGDSDPHDHYPESSSKSEADLLANPGLCCPRPPQTAVLAYKQEEPDFAKRGALTG
jgi:hypothetical protein